jgi:hypothetical protein
LIPGKHTIEVLGVRKQFRLTSKVAASSTDLYDCCGFEVCQTRGIAIPVKEPGAAKTGHYMNCKVTIVIGGLLL